MSSTHDDIPVSVVIPTYNRSRLVCEAIDSVVAQHHPALEIIVVDDGSTDDTSALLQARYGDAVTVLHQQNRGFGAARNRGVAAATGRYIAFIDSDDIWLAGKLALQLAVMERFPELAYCFSDFVIFNEAGRYDHRGLQTWFSVSSSWNELLPRREHLAFKPLGENGGEGAVDVFIGDLYHHLLSQCYVLPSTAMVRASCIGDGVRHTENDPYCADWDFFALLSRAYQAGFIDTETALNRSHDDAVRLTRSMDAAEKAGYRLASIARVWKADRAFAERHRDEIARVEAGLLLQQATCWYRAGRTAESKAALAAYRRCGVPVGTDRARLLGILTMIPFSAMLVRALLNLRR